MNTSWENDRPDMTLIGDAHRRLRKTLLHTGMMNERFVQMIESKEVTEEYVIQALANFRQALHPGPHKVQRRYVLGFLFSEDGSRVLLIWKNRPAWQAGKLNGIGGKIEDGEQPLDAMKREFVEETLFVGYGDLRNAEWSSANSTRPEWHLVGKRGRVAMFDDQPGSYEMFIYAATIPDVRWAVHGNPHPLEPTGLVTHWDNTTQNEPNREEVIALPMNREIISRRGVPGLAWTVDASLQALRESFQFDVQDHPDMETVELLPVLSDDLNLDALFDLSEMIDKMEMK